MRHIFRFIQGCIKHHVNAFWKSFWAGSIAYFGILLGISSSIDIDFLSVLWIGFKAFFVGLCTAMGTTVWAEIVSRYKQRKLKKDERRKSEKEKAA